MGFPNLALLKLSQWHKEKGDEIIWNFPLLSKQCSHTYISGVFSWSGYPYDYDGVLLGGLRFDKVGTLPDSVEHNCPDYSTLDYSIGFLSRGCIRNCDFCIVQEKEGWIRPHSKPTEFIRHNKAVLLDNNWLASPRWEQDWEWLYKNKIKCDFNQGLDVRLVDRQVAERLAKLRWIRFIRFACDSQGMKGPVSRAVQSLRSCGYSGEIFVYSIIMDDIEDALDRIEFLRHNNCDPFAQPFRDESGDIKEDARRFARWVNHKAIFKTVKWQDYHG